MKLFLSDNMSICQKSSSMTPTFFILFCMHTIQTRFTRSIMTLTRPVFCQFKYYFRIHSKLSEKLCYFFTETSRNEHPVDKFNKFLYDGIKVDNFFFLSLCHTICYKKNLLCENVITWRRIIARKMCDFCYDALKPCLTKSGTARKRARWPMNFFRLMYSKLSWEQPQTTFDTLTRWKFYTMDPP